MSKWFEISATVAKVFVVEVEDDEDAKNAVDFVREELSGLDVSIPENRIREITTESDLKLSQLCANEVCSL